MLRLSRKVEYGLIALQYMAQRPHTLVTGKELSAACHLSYELTAKVLQQLARSNVVRAVQGIRGGYLLEKPPESISVADVIYCIEGKVSPLMECSEDHSACNLEDHCTIKHPLKKLQDRIATSFSEMTIRELLPTNLDNSNPLVQIAEVKL